jgi:hypothetical protein
VTTTTSTAAPWFYGLSLRGSGSCPQNMKVSPVPLSQCQEAAMKAQLPPGRDDQGWDDWMEILGISQSDMVDMVDMVTLW